MTINYDLLEKSLSLVKLCKNEEALIYLDKIIDSEPNNNVAWYLKSIIYERLENFSEQKMCFKKSQDVMHLDKKSDFTHNLAQLDKLFGVFPYDIKGINIRARLMAKLHNNVDFLSFLREHLKLLEDAVVYHENFQKYDFGYRLIWEKMKPLLNSLVRENDKASISKKYTFHEPIILHIGVTLYQFSLFDQIIMWLKLLIEEYEINSTCFFNNIGVSLLKRIDESNAISYFEEALKIEQKYIFSFNNLGVSYNSVSFFNDILKIDSKNITACYNKATALYKNDYPSSKKNLKKALKYCKIVLKKTPNDYGCWYLQGLVHEKLGNLTQALKCYEKALTSSPNNVDVLSVQGKLLIKMEKYNEAVKVLDWAIELNPENILYFLEDKVEIYQKLKKEKEEFNCYERMLEHFGGHTSAYLGKGRLLVDRGNYDEAVKSLDRVDGGENFDNLWPYAIFHKARAAALQDYENKAFQLIRESIRAGAFFIGYSGEYRLKELINKSPEFEKYKSMEKFVSILDHDYSTKEEMDRYSKYNSNL